jgi:hypothetical protein
VTYFQTLTGALGSALAYITGTIGGTNVLSANLAPAAGTASSWQWTRNGSNIGGATSSTYTQVPAMDAGTVIGVTINGTYTASVTVPAIPPVSGNFYIARRVAGNAVYA